MAPTQEHSAPYRADFAPVAALMADSTRAVMLNALLAGRPLAAGELGRMAGVSPATASAHLAKLLDGGMITVTVQGRHRYYRLAGRGERRRSIRVTGAGREGLAETFGWSAGPAGGDGTVAPSAGARP